MLLPYWISGICGFVIVLIVVALIFSEAFRSSMLADSNSQISIGVFSVEGIVLVVIFALFIFGLIFPLVLHTGNIDVNSPSDGTSNVITAKDGENRTNISSELTRQINNYFEGKDWLAPNPATVMAEARGIVQRFKSEPNTFETIQEEIEERKKNDPNWTFANELKGGLELVNILGLSPNTENKNEIFLTMELPAVSAREAPR